jgi:hypothetical protein|tara:strand:- start:108 stop:293 length:186 start_codon:yes stop_codon:yes gene_type:complete
MQPLETQQLRFQQFGMNLFLSLTLWECLQYSYNNEETELKDWMIDQVISAGQTILGVMPEA